MGIETLLLAGTSLVGGSMASRSSRRAAQSQEQQAQAAIDENRRQFDVAQENQRPFLDAGRNALLNIQSQLASPDWQANDDKLPDVPNEQYRAFTQADFEADPGYQFRRAEGERALENRLIAGGKFFSGSALKNASRFNQDFASNEFGRAYDRFQNDQTQRFQRGQTFFNNALNRQNTRFNQRQVDRANRLAPWQAMAGQGQSSAAQVASLGQGYAQSNANLMSNMGDARAAGRVGSNNAWTDTINNMFSIYRQMPRSNIPPSSMIPPPGSY